MLALLQQQSEVDHRKIFLIQIYDLVKTSLKVLRNETNPRIILTLHLLIVNSIVKDINQYELYDHQQTDLQNIELSYLDQFFQYEGVEIYEDLKLKYCNMKELNQPLMFFSNKFFDLDPKEIHHYH